MTGITNPTEALFKDGLWGWDLTQWRKLPLIWGWQGAMTGQCYDPDSAGGDITVNGTTVPDDEVWVLEACAITNLTRGIALAQIQVSLIGLTLGLAEGAIAAAGNYVYWSGRVTLSPGSNMRGVWYGTTVDDVLYLPYGGYKMKIAE